GILFVNDMRGEFTAETTVNLPSQFRNVMQLTLPNRKIALVQILNGEKAIVTLDGQPQKVEAAAPAAMRDTQRLERAVRLTALLSDKAYRLEALDEIKVGDKPAVGVKVSAKGQRDLKMYFDKESGLLVRTAHTMEESGKEVEQVELYSEFKDLEGYKRP